MSIHFSPGARSFGGSATRFFVPSEALVQKPSDVSSYRAPSRVTLAPVNRSTVWYPRELPAVTALLFADTVYFLALCERITPTVAGPSSSHVPWKSVAGLYAISRSKGA